MSKENAEINLIILTGAILLLIIVGFVVLFMFYYQGGYYNHERKLTQLKEEAAHELLKAQLEIQEMELKRVSKEIHDNCGQMLSLVKLNLNVIHTRMNAGDLSTLLVEETKNLIGDIITDLRNLSKSLSSDIVERLGFVKALKFETDRLCKTDQFHCHILVEGAIRRMNTEVEIILFRIAQESIQNIINHSKATNVYVLIRFYDENLEFSIRDDGIGFNISEADIESRLISGSGLQNFYSRAKLIGASLLIKSDQGYGTSIQLSLPIERELTHFSV